MHAIYRKYIKMFVDSFKGNRNNWTMFFHFSFQKILIHPPSQPTLGLSLLLVLVKKYDVNDPGYPRMTSLLHFRILLESPTLLPMINTIYGIQFLKIACRMKCKYLSLVSIKIPHRKSCFSIYWISKWFNCYQCGSLEPIKLTSFPYP